MKKVGYATGSRAEYGIVRKYLLQLKEQKDIDLGVLVTGTHLEVEFGHTIDEIKGDGLQIDCEVPIAINTVDNAHVLSSMSICLKEFGKVFENNKYDLLIILGDRYEMMMVAIAAAMNNIPILHLHGGEITLGNYDEFIRHSITKMSKYHFTSTEAYRKRVIQLGESPDTVYYLGALGSENAKKNVVADSKFSNQGDYLVVLFHPETITNVDETQQIDELLLALDEFKGDYKIKFIGNNADTNADIIKRKVMDYCEKNDCDYYINLRNADFHNLVYNAACFVGNSSSGLIEAPSLNVFTVNIGDRQRGRIRGNSVIDIRCERTAIAEGIQKAIDSKKNRTTIDNPYYKEDCLKQYVNATLKILKNIDTEPKAFFDVTVNSTLLFS